MRKIVITLFIILAIVGVGLISREKKTASLTEKIYVAVEGEGKIAVINPQTYKVIENIDLSVSHEGGTLTFAPHNVQAAPNSQTVWVTANAGQHMDHTSFLPKAQAHTEEKMMSQDADQIIVINPKTDQIIKRISIAAGIHLAHVVLDPESRYAYINAQKEDALYKINTETFTVESEFKLPAKSEPHGLRISPDGKTAVIAILEGKSLALFDILTQKIESIPLDGKAVQAGITHDGKTAFASLYDTKKLAVLDLATKELSYIPLPDNAKGPIQMYPTPDSKFVYLADQGYYFNQPAGDTVYKIDLETKQVVKEIKGGEGPHGVVVSKDGRFVYITNLLSGDLSVIDTATDTEIKRIAIGKEPNGISIWSRSTGGTP